MRLRYKEWALPELKDNDLMYFDPVENKGRWKEVFGNDNPIYLEIGAGRGKFTRVSAELHPDINYIALEMEAGAFVYAGRLFKESELTNIRGIKTVAQKLLDFFEEDEVDRIYINFCNPWPKNRQHKRRLTYPDFLERYQVVLKNGGQIRLKTDDKGFFEDSIKYFEKSKFEIEEIDRDLPFDKDGNIVTEYEAKWRQKGIEINYLRASLKK